MDWARELAVVLLADDDADARELLAQLLARRGYTVRTAADGDELVRTYLTLARSGQPPRVIVTDIDMPGCDGVAAVRRLREAGMDVPVVFITGKSSAEQLAEARRMGVALRKPLDVDELIDKVADAAPGS